MDIRKLSGINTKINNIYRIPVPYWWGRDNTSKESCKSLDKKMIIVFGNDLSGTLVLGVEEKPYVAKFNECLDYIRKKFEGYDFYYKPHPADKDEQLLLDLKGFNIADENITSELFLWNNLNKIKATFSVGSASSFGSYMMGLSSHVFYKCFSGIHQQEYIWNSDDMFFEMPASFFINDLNQELTDNSRILKKDELLKLNLKKILSRRKGNIWFICSFSESIVILSILSELIKSLEPNRRIGLIVNRNHRWNLINTEYFRHYFDEIIFFPRIFYSLKPTRLWKAIKTAWQIKNLKILPGDILIAASFPEFVEDCCISYHKKNLKIGFMTNRDFNGIYNLHNLIWANNNDFRFNKATWFYNKIFEPFLGIHRTIYMAFSQKKGFYMNRYQRPINELFDEVYIMDNPHNS